MKNNTVKLRFEADSQLISVIPYPVDTNIYFSLDPFIVRKVKTDDIGVEIMFQELTVNIEECFICTENKIDDPCFFTFFFKNR